ncbi:MAG: LytR C-terminal domain-containing protein [Syntrophales bacterium]
MTYRRMMYVPMLLLFLTMAGCTAGRVFDAGSPEEQRKSATSKDELWNQTVALEKENAAYQKQIAAQQAELDRLNKELTDQQMEIDQTSKQATELTGAVDDLTAKVKQLQDARLREHPLKEATLTQPEKATVRQKTAIPKREPPKKSRARNTKPKSARDAQVKMLQETEPKIPPPQEVEPPPVKKDAGKEPAEMKVPKPRSVEDLSAQMKQFEEARQKGAAMKETEPEKTKKEPQQQAKKTALPRKEKETQQELAEPKGRAKAATIKVLAGDGDIASARGLAKQLGKMGYRVKLVDRAPRSDFEVTTVYYGADHRAAAETMAKRLGGGATARPLTWSSSFDIIVVTGRQQ